MKTAFSYLNERIAPVFDTAANICLLDQKNTRTEITLTSNTAAGKAAQLAECGVCTLVCGAISKELETIIIAQGIRVISFVAGEMETTIQAWQNKRINRAGRMPGCCGQGQGRQNRCGQNRHRAKDCYCVCPECGAREPHRIGQPCAVRKCSNCGALMRKE